MIDHNLIQYAFDEKGKRVSVFDVPTGKNTGCFCRICGNPLGAKNKDKSRDKVLGPYQKAAHFYHPPESNCQGESLIHILAKEVFRETKKLNFELEVINHLGKYIGKEEGFVEFEDVTIEEKINIKDGNWIRPDAIGFKEGKILHVEFANTSYVGYEKERQIKSKNINVVEIELNDPTINWNTYTEEKELKERIKELLHTKSIDSGNWVNNYDFQPLITKIVDTTLEDLENEKRAIQEKIELCQLELKKAIIGAIWEVEDLHAVDRILAFEQKRYYLNDDHFIINGEEIVIKEETFDELIKLKEICWKEWVRLKVNIYD